MIDSVLIFLILSLLYFIRLYISIRSHVSIQDIMLTSFLGPSVIWMKIYGTVLSFCGIKVYYMIEFDRENVDPSVE